jgi:hypothetical protein
LINIEKDYQLDIDAIVADFLSKKDERKKSIWYYSEKFY